jgi:hypothetical protein
MSYICCCQIRHFDVLQFERDDSGIAMTMISLLLKDAL